MPEVSAFCYTSWPCARRENPAPSFGARWRGMSLSRARNTVRRQERFIKLRAVGFSLDDAPFGLLDNCSAEAVQPSAHLSARSGLELDAGLNAKAWRSPRLWPRTRCERRSHEFELGDGDGRSRWSIGSASPACGIWTRLAERARKLGTAAGPLLRGDRRPNLAMSLASPSPWAARWSPMLASRR